LAETVAGAGICWRVSAKWEHDFNAHNTFEGDVIALSLTVGL